MKKAISLAKKGRGNVSPNPMVGAVIVKDGRIIGWGYHKRVGSPHAEVVAAKKAKELKGATLYVNLEPCCHYGRTPPCTHLLIKEGIKRVVIATLDPNPLVNGRGVKELMDAGIEVDVGCMKEEAERLNEAYFKYMHTGMPFVILKAALSMDGRITSSTAWITGEESRRYVHRLRAEVDGVLVGSGTIHADNPQLTVRFCKGRNPKRIIISTDCALPLNARVFEEEGTIVCTTKKAFPESIKSLEEKGARIIFSKEKDGMVDLEDALRHLAKEGILSILVEGGRRIFTSILNLSLADKFMLFFAPRISGSSYLPFVNTLRDEVQLKINRIKKIGKDFFFEGYVYRDYKRSRESS